MKVYLLLFFPWNQKTGEVDHTGHTDAIEVEGGPYSYHGDPPEKGDVVWWNPDEHDESPEGGYQVVHRKLMVGSNIEPHWVIECRHDPWAEARLCG